MKKFKASQWLIEDRPNGVIYRGVWWWDPDYSRWRAGEDFVVDSLAITYLYVLLRTRTRPP